MTVPDMPHSFFPRKKEWLKVIEDFNPDENSILIGHSLGGTTILWYLEKTDKKIAKCIFVATPIGKLGPKEIDNFFEPDFDWEKIKKAAEKFVVLNQKEDSVVNIKNGEDLARHLGTDLILAEGNDHFDTIDFSLLEKYVLE